MRLVGVVALLAIGCGSDGSGDGTKPSGGRDAGQDAHVTATGGRDAGREASTHEEASAPPLEAGTDATVEPRDAASEASTAPDGSQIVPVADAAPEAGAGGARGSGGAPSTGGVPASGGVSGCIPYLEACAGHTCEYVPNGCRVGMYYCSPPESPATKCVSEHWDCQIFKDSCGGEFQCQPSNKNYECDGATKVLKPACDCATTGWTCGTLCTGITCGPLAGECPSGSRCELVDASRKGCVPRPGVP